MAFKWDDIFKYDTGFNPNYEAQASTLDPNIGRNRFASMAMPEYNDAPLRRYTEYLGTEPTRDQYRPGKVGNVINALSGGLESMTSGSIGRGVQLYEGLRDRGYDDAYKDWSGRASKYKSEADLENQSYARRVAAYNNAQENANRERNTQVAEGNLGLRSKELDLKVQEYNDNGYAMKLGPKGTLVGTRIRNGQVETIDTPLPNDKLTAQQELEQDKMLEQGRNSRNERSVGASIANNMRSVGASKYSADMQNKSAQMRDATDRYEGRKSRESQERIQGMPRRPDPNDTTTPTPSDLRNPRGLVEKGYPEFNNPDLIKMDGNELILQADPVKIEAVLRKEAKGDEGKYQLLKKRWMEFDSAADFLAGTPKTRSVGR